MQSLTEFPSFFLNCLNIIKSQEMTDNNFCLISDDIDETIARNASGVEIDMAPKIEGSPLSKGMIIYKRGEAAFFSRLPGPLSRCVILS